jgi:hypothetical protein
MDNLRGKSKYSGFTRTKKRRAIELQIAKLIVDLQLHETEVPEMNIDEIVKTRGRDISIFNIYIIFD